MKLYVLNEEGIAVPACYSDYSTWEAKLSQDQRCALGKRLATDFVGPVSIVTLFSGVALGLGGGNGRKVICWITLAVGPEFWAESCYTSHRAALDGHKTMVSRVKRKAAKLSLIAG